MSISEIIKTKNHMVMKSYPTLPDAFKNRSIQAVVRGLMAAGYEVFDVEIDGQKINMARKNEVEIYFNKKEAVYTVSDYGNVEGKIFNIDISGVFQVGKIPANLWCKV